MRVILSPVVRNEAAEIIATFCAYIHLLLAGRPEAQETQKRLERLGVFVTVRRPGNKEGGAA